MFYQGKNVLVAGGAGLVGQSLVRKLLTLGANVRTTQFRSRKISFTHKNLQVISCDLRNEEEAKPLFKDIDVVFLAAGVVGGAKKIKEDPFFNALQVKFAYAVTCHKAQGGQWPCVFVEQGYLTDDMMNTEYLRWLYTAMTRASEKLYLVNFNKEFFGVTNNE